MKRIPVGLGLGIILCVAIVSFSTFLLGLYIDDQRMNALSATKTENSQPVNAAERAEANKKATVQWRQRDADEFIGNVKYYKDSRTNLCFAVYWTTYDGWHKPRVTAVMLVPEQSIPKDLLIVGQPTQH